ncbi:MAG: mannose-1-phosphate guanylyltransferase/mannose-6-phosphate isomerase [Polaromonas sp.]|uniref:mannose-1-phosphate guanylyltransferase/mannose-6-phosphate isomerase n=1 Tax=Polaromonas sp. TaxID=1869339 RepID=UPI0027188B5A|nr:mannose-1-phosphate guanylyltransferase/mannose-6-phosphate isomerase [Polaromonas sp.]MDO9112923.1 mannose-1-phosphate guanylyltransferase/mannose-6-phosphate isomerase [Polaromonas sp.]MDP1885122.1 mannose-1-phosphate guanylyltransferase/mannose-6-phosphate isomerase [Polaromonas sp.]MDP2450450.1 mannose-1-phosphate guanylyltransferase/mannose-6-phosphate isomerase [Polaromonas sp.]MDP3247186.1 mannose-1-phosphate guanylyltransferase/mannose-6-phosphate isomerase [Polaromonas sp.]MDP37566
MTILSVRPVILCGGSGTRLWPLSRAGFPKQFLVLSGTDSLFQQALLRINGLVADDISLGQALIVTNEEHRFLALDQLRDIKQNSATLLLEPAGRNTAPALALAALEASQNGQDPILVVSPADQTVSDMAAFTTALRQSIRAAAGGAIVVLGITPDHPETGYGYIQHKEIVGGQGEYKVAQFVEKPDAETAISYLESGNFFWNSGMFVLRASIWLRALKYFRPDIADLTQAAWSGRTIDPPFVRPEKSLFAAIPADSIDYAVMEKCPGSTFPVHMVPLDAGWSDLGAWNAVWQVGGQDAKGNVTQGDTLLVDTSNTLVHASNRLVSAVGVSNLVIVETADAVLVADRNQSQNVKKIVGLLETQKRAELGLHRKVHRPWGWYDSIDEAERFKVKRIMVKPGASLSLQKHHHRAEHWIVVKGTAEVTCGNKVILLTENQSTYIPLGEVHRLANPGNIPLEIIEVQSGSYLGEDDILRFEDTYGRS